MPTVLKSRPPDELEFLDRSVRDRSLSLFSALAIHKTHRGKYLDLDKYPSMKALYTDIRAFGAVMKSVQGGVSEWLLVKGITEAADGRNIFWVLPAYPLVTRFVKERFDKSMALTPQYQSMVRDVEQSRFAMATSMKQFGNGTIVFVGSQSASAFTEFVADTVIVDELDRCDQKNIEMASDRYGFAEDPHDWRVSNPTITGFGIDAAYGDSTKGVWHIQCDCGQQVFPDPFKVLMRRIEDDIYVVRDDDFERDGIAEPRIFCPHCDRALNRYGEGVWIEEYPSRPVAGYHFSRIFTSNTTLRSVVMRFDAGLADEAKLERCYNADFGWPFNSPGSKITRDALLGAIGKHRRGISQSGRCVMGVDVGRVLHVTIARLVERLGDTPAAHVVYVGTVRALSEALELYHDYRCVFGVIDAQPEMRLSRRFTKNTHGGFRCFYGVVKTDITNEKQRTLTVRRTPALDAVKEGLITGAIALPIDVESVEDFFTHMQASTRVAEERADGTIEYVWREGKGNDHYHHSMAYLMFARVLAISAAH